MSLKLQEMEVGMKRKVLLMLMALLAGGCGYPYPTAVFRPSNLGAAIRDAVEIEASVKTKLVVPCLIPEASMDIVGRRDGIFVFVRAPFDTDALMEAYRKEVQKRDLHNVTVKRDKEKP